MRTSIVIGLGGLRVSDSLFRSSWLQCRIQVGTRDCPTANDRRLAVRGSQLFQQLLVQSLRVVLIIRLWAGDQSDITCCCELSALTVTGYVPVADQAWDAVTDLPLGTDQLHRDFCPSPQSNWYWMESPLGPVVEAVKVYVKSGSPEEGPMGADGVVGAPVFNPRRHAGSRRATTKARTAVLVSLEYRTNMKPPFETCCGWDTRGCITRRAPDRVRDGSDSMVTA
ncbi:MAG TPA: hypothetical protein VMH22_08975 [bacterium]|nr:hypothetical protein [bacterium]